MCLAKGLLKKYYKYTSVAILYIGRLDWFVQSHVGFPREVFTGGLINCVDHAEILGIS